MSQDSLLSLPPEMMAKLLRNGDFSRFGEQQLSEDYLRDVAAAARAAGYLDILVADLISRLVIRPTRDFDWNTGSLLQHADSEVVFDNLPSRPPQREALYESIGLTWCLGEFGKRDPRVVAFLEDAVARARSAASWLRAAQSLEKLGLVDSISYLKASLRAQGIPPLASCLADLADARQRIGVLLHTTVDTLQHEIIPRLREVLCDPDSDAFQKLGAAWLAGRFRFRDPEIETALLSLVYSEHYELRFYALQAIKELRGARFVPVLLEYLESTDPLLRKMAAQGLAAFHEPRIESALDDRLLVEPEADVVSAITSALYDISHHAHLREREIERTIGANENGMIADEGDKWYINPDIYHVFSQSQDPENLAFRTVMRQIRRTAFLNPIDLGSGTGRFAAFLLSAVTFEGQLICLDASDKMVHFLQARFRREGIPETRFRVLHGRTEALPSLVAPNSSDLVVANFAFPSKLADRPRALCELAAVHTVLRPAGLLVTVGWDETFNDELSEMWYKYVPDGIQARNFEEWRRARACSIASARNCGLSWFKVGFRVPIEFTSDQEAARVMGYLFGRGAAQEILHTKQTRWSMSLGITIDSRESIGSALAKTAAT